MARKPSSRRWLDRQRKDQFVKKAQADGWRSRAVFKLQQIDEREKLLRAGAVVVDLGAAPGGWSQYCASRLQGQGKVIAIDLLPIQPMTGVTCLQGDFREADIRENLGRLLDSKGADLVLSDMAPNLSGIVAADHWRAMELAELARDFAFQTLKPGGNLLIKLFQGEGVDAFLRDLRSHFRVCAMRKPDASRAESREVYLIAREFGDNI